MLLVTIKDQSSRLGSNRLIKENHYNINNFKFAHEDFRWKIKTKDFTSFIKKQRIQIVLDVTSLFLQNLTSEIYIFLLVYDL